MKSNKAFLFQENTSGSTIALDWCEAESALLESNVRLNSCAQQDGITAPSSLNQQTQITSYLLREWQKEEDERALNKQKPTPSIAAILTPRCPEVI